MSLGLYNKSPKGSKQPLAKLTEGDIEKIMIRIATGQTQRSIAADFGVSESLISMIKHGKLWRHVCRT